MPHPMFQNKQDIMNYTLQTNEKLVKWCENEVQVTEGENCIQS